MERGDSLYHAHEHLHFRGKIQEHFDGNNQVSCIRPQRGRKAPAPLGKGAMGWGEGILTRALIERVRGVAIPVTFEPSF
ncbi:hypothetical protein GW17_00041812 [Ensete ventricosum]|nr:hypothetical protein GW17_00041812 [Ensete ventricosum]